MNEEQRRELMRTAAIRHAEQIERWKANDQVQEILAMPPAPLPTYQELVDALCGAMDQQQTADVLQRVRHLKGVV